MILDVAYLVLGVLALAGMAVGLLGLVLDTMREARDIDSVEAHRRTMDALRERR